MTQREMVPFFGFYCGVPMTGKTPPDTLIRAADAAVRAAAKHPHLSQEAQALLTDAERMKQFATTGQ